MTHQQSLAWVTNGTTGQVPEVVSGAPTISGTIPRNRIGRVTKLLARNDALSGDVNLEFYDEYGRDHPATASGLISSFRFAVRVLSGQNLDVDMKEAYKFIGTPLLTSDSVGIETTMSMEME